MPQILTWNRAWRVMKSCQSFIKLYLTWWNIMRIVSFVWQDCSLGQIEMTMLDGADKTKLQAYPGQLMTLCCNLTGVFVSYTRYPMPWKATRAVPGWDINQPWHLLTRQKRPLRTIGLFRGKSCKSCRDVLWLAVNKLWSHLGPLWNKGIGQRFLHQEDRNSSIILLEEQINDSE